MPDYDGTNFDPPAPVAAVTVRYSTSGEVVVDVLMLLDSGADATLLPQHVAEQLGLSGDESDVYELVGFNEARSTSQAVRADVRLLGKTFSGRFLVTPNSWGILERNVLNHLNLRLDGPNLQWELERLIGSQHR
jgi:hypothetical protein